MAIPKSITSLIKEIEKTYREKSAADEQDKNQNREEILEIAITEMRRVNKWLDHAFTRMKDLTRAYLGAGLVTLTFLYASGDTFIPHETYGRIFYFIGLGLFIIAMTLFFAALLPRHWEFSIENKDIEDLKFSTKLEYLEYVKERYYIAYKMNLKTYQENRKLLDFGFYPLIFGAIILAVLKIFGT